MSETPKPLKFQNFSYLPITVRESSRLVGRSGGWTVANRLLNREFNIGKIRNFEESAKREPQP